MSFLIITHVKHIRKDGEWFAYGPYVREMNLWIKKFNRVIIIAPISNEVYPNAIDIPYSHPNIKFIKVPTISFTNTSNKIKSTFALPIIIFKTIYAMLLASHIHVRCPGNMGLIGMFVQILFPFKTKTAKYAGNWDPNSNQPRSYRLQQSLLNNTMLTHNMSGLIYGEWPNITKNIIPFFTASYNEKLRTTEHHKTFEINKPIIFMMVGTLTKNKGPLDALKYIHQLSSLAYNIEIHYYGEGPLTTEIKKEAEKLGIQNQVILHGNLNETNLISAYKESHFLLLLSKSEGWPKAVAEAMWWGVVPISKSISCVPWMINHGERGLLLKDNLKANCDEIASLIQDKERYTEISKQASIWSQQYTLEKFESEINKFI